MIYSGKTTSVNTVIAKVMRDLDLKEENIFINFLEWSAEALEKIGAFTQLETKILEIEIFNYRGELPNDLVYMNQVSYNNTPLMSNATDLKFSSNRTKPYAFYQEKIENAAFTGLDKQLGGSDIQHRFVISNGCIKTTFERGKIMMSYQAMPVDEDGFPLIPDYTEFKDAVYWYINMKWSYAQWRMGTIRDAIYQHAEQQWNWYCQSAANKAMIPDLNQLENIKRSYITLKPNINKFSTFFNR